MVVVIGEGGVNFGQAKVRVRFGEQTKLTPAAQEGGRIAHQRDYANGDFAAADVAGIALRLK